jgi:hypothetical protein
MSSGSRLHLVSFALKKYPTSGVQLIWHIADDRTECAVFSSRNEALEALQRAGMTRRELDEARDEGYVTHFKAYLSDETVRSLGFLAMGIRLL